MEKFWENVKTKRQLMKVSQADMATALGIKQPTYAYFESGRGKSVTKHMINTIARMLETEPKELLEENKNPLEDYPEEIVEWLKKKESKEYILAAYMEYLKKRL